jgi:hypothetical protein
MAAHTLCAFLIDRSELMKKTAFVFLISGMLQAQNVVYQQAGAIGGGFGMVTAPMMGGRTMTGSPFSGTEQRHSLQVLGDGTRIEQTETSQIVRDVEGRMRTETAPAMVTIQDPVAGTSYFLDSVHKTASKMPMPKMLSRESSGVKTAVASRVASDVQGEMAKVVAETMFFQTTSVSKGQVNAPAPEDLGVQNINGVLAKGTRTTINIPAGQIGNDRPIQVVNERWFSDELGMIVKSSNSDPRFGTTTYELTNISRAAPDPSQFQVPADYTINEGKVLTTTSPK